MKLERKRGKTGQNTHTGTDKKIEHKEKEGGEKEAKITTGEKEIRNRPIKIRKETGVVLVLIK